MPARFSDKVVETFSELVDLVWRRTQPVSQADANTSLLGINNERMIRIKPEDLPAGGGSGPIESYEESFSASLSWIVNHNLGRRPVVTLLTQGGTEMIAEVAHVNLNQFVTYFASPTAGSVRCV